MNEYDNDFELEGRSRGLGVREEVLALLTGPIVAGVLQKLSQGAAIVNAEEVLTAQTCAWVLQDLCRDGGWRREFWRLDQHDDAQLVSQEGFDDVPADHRFSNNECLRVPARHSWCLRGLLSAVVSEEVRVSLSAAFGCNVRFRSADIARYTLGDYLRRHADTFENRRFGFVWFFSEGWQPGYGGELIVEGDDGAAKVIAPQKGMLVALAFRPSYFHKVAAVSSSRWARYSIATHFHALQ